ALWTASSLGRTAEVRQLLADGADIHQRERRWKSSPLHAASERGHGEVVGLLLDKGAAVSATSNLGSTPLHWAANEAVTRLLLEHGAEVSAKNNLGESPLHWAAIRGRESVVHLLMDTGADVLSEAKDGRTPEGLATSRGHPQIAAMI
ncbi:ankyrin repeat-containing domain protein, partial [Baffinella frigidus]